MPTTLSRSFLVIILPGVVAAAPWLLIISSRLQGFSDFYKEYQLVVNACLFAFVVIVGSLFEGVNSHLEIKWDKEREKEYGVEKNWYDYLALVCNAEPVGFKYIARMVTLMYFELSMMLASVLFGTGVLALLVSHAMPCWAVMLTAVLTVAAPLYFWWQAKCSHEVLCRSRKELNDRLCKDG
jgi:hypothetical protein